MIIIKTEKKVGVYLQDSPDGKELRQIKSMDELSGLNPNDYQIIKENNPTRINDLDKAKQSSSFGK